MLELNDFSNSESQCHSDASHPLSSFPLTVWRCLLKNFKMTTILDSEKNFSISESLMLLRCHQISAQPTYGHGGHLGYLNRTILAILKLFVSDHSHKVSVQSDLWFGRRRLKNFKMATVGVILNIGTEF